MMVTNEQLAWSVVRDAWYKFAEGYVSADDPASLESFQTYIEESLPVGWDVVVGESGKVLAMFQYGPNDLYVIVKEACGEEQTYPNCAFELGRPH